MSVRVFVGDAQVDAIPAGDRGFAYGDGLFETMRAHEGDVPWWPAHRSRLERGAERLRIALPDLARVQREVAAAAAHGNGAVKLVVSRGAGGRGYALPDDATPAWTVAWHPLPVAMPSDGLTLRWCETQLAIQPALSGLKHCNRLEQVLARMEWSADAGVDEGLMRSVEGDVVSATAANLFALVDGRWLTPMLDRCGVAGVCRQHLLPLAGAHETRITPAMVEAADALVLCNAVRGILPVARLGERRWAPHPAVSALRRALAGAHPAFVFEEGS